MKKSLVSTTVLLALLCGCASYNAASLNTLSTDIVKSSDSNDNLMVVAKAFDKRDCKTYLDRDVIGKGYQPVQLLIQNDSAKNYSFSLSGISLTCARPEEVARKVHTSTVGRAVGYGAASLIFWPLAIPAVVGITASYVATSLIIWPLAIPAIVDGVKSSNANEALDKDFLAKTARDQLLHAHN